MKCPACKEPFVALEMEGVEVDWCPSCQGVWLDAGELELLHTDSKAAGRFMSDLKPASLGVFAAGTGSSASGGHPQIAHPVRRCPICEKRMEPVESAWDPSIVLDRCSKNDGLWFDKGELTRVLRLRGGSDGVKNFLTGIFTEK